MKQLIQPKGISLNVESIWAKALTQCSNPLGLDDDVVKESLEKLTIDEKGLFLNMLGGRVPLGYRVKGATGDEVLRSILSGLERVVSRISTISGRLDEVILKSD